MFMAESKAPSSRPVSKWKFRLLSDILPPILGEKETLSVKPSIQDLEDSYHTNKHNILFRSHLKVRDAHMTNAFIHLAFLPNVMISLTLFDNDIEIANARGKGSATIRSVFLHLVEDSKANDTRKNPATTTIPILNQKHKYVLQAKAETNLEKLPNRPNTSGRPASISGKPGSTKGKRSIAVAKIGTPPAAEDSKWKLRLIATEPGIILLIIGAFFVTKDTEKEDLFRSIKDGWELSQPGRLQFARDVRESYSKLVESGQISPVTILVDDRIIKPWSIVKENSPMTQITSEKEKRVTVQEPTVETIKSYQDLKEIKDSKDVKDTKDGVKETKEAKDTAKESKEEKDVKELKEKDEGVTVYKSLILKTATAAKIMEVDHVHQSIQEVLAAIENGQKWYQEFKQLRICDKENRIAEKRMQNEVVDIKMKEMDFWLKIDLNLREQYRQRVLREAEELEIKLKVAQEARVALEVQESLAAGEEAAKGKKGKKF
jgi:hypothetical protein